MLVYAIPYIRFGLIVNGPMQWTLSDEIGDLLINKGIEKSCAIMVKLGDCQRNSDMRSDARRCNQQHSWHKGNSTNLKNGEYT